MADSATPATKAPWHLWVVGVLAVLWNAMGVMDFSMTHFNGEAWLKNFTAEQRAYILSFPLWAEVAWGAGVYGGFIGSLLLLFRKRWAVTVFVVSPVGVIGSDLYSYGVTDSRKIMGGGAGAVVFAAVILGIAVALLAYARRVAARGVLR